MCIYVITYVKRKSQKMQMKKSTYKTRKMIIYVWVHEGGVFLQIKILIFSSLDFFFYTFPLKVKILPCPNNCLFLPRKMGSIISNIGYM